MPHSCFLRVILSFAIGVVLAPHSAVAQGPSFDCARANTAVEGAICGSAALSALDRQLASTYSARRAALGPSERDRLLAEQRSWLGIRDRCGADTSCLTEVMRARVAALESGAAAGPSDQAKSAPAAVSAPRAGYMGRWRPYGREADFFSAMTLTPTRLAYDSGLVFDLRQVRSGSNVFQVLASKGFDPGICGNEKLTYFAFAMTSDGLLQLHAYRSQSAPADPPPMTVENMGSGGFGNCSVSHYYR